jgi:hypothetical protein
MLYIDDLGKYYYCPLKRNRLVDDTAGNEDYKKIETLSWNETELKGGKIIKIKKFPGCKKVKLFRVTVFNTEGCRHDNRGNSWCG